MTAPVGEVAVDVSAVPPDPRGAGRYAIELVRALDRRGRVPLRLVARTDDAERWSSVAPGARVEAVAPTGRAVRLMWEQVSQPRLLERWGVAASHGLHYTMPERARLPRIVTVHDLTFFDHPEWHERVKVPVFRRAIRVAARQADAIVCVSGATARRLAELCQPACGVHVVPHGVDHDAFRPDAPPGHDEVILDRLGVRQPYLVFVGTLEPRKGLTTLAGAFDLVAGDHPDLSLVLAGGTGWGGAGLLEAFDRSRFASRIVRTGYVPDAAVPPLLRGADAVVYPSLEEGFGLPALEALACGAPLVTTAGSVMAELVDGAARLVAGGDSAALAAALAALVAGDPDQPARRNTGLTVAARHTWDASAAGHERVYAAAIESRQRA